MPVITVQLPWEQEGDAVFWGELHPGLGLCHRDITNRSPLYPLVESRYFFSAFIEAREKGHGFG